MIDLHIIIYTPNKRITTLAISCSFLFHDTCYTYIIDSMQWDFLQIAELEIRDGNLKFFIMIYQI